MSVVFFSEAHRRTRRLTTSRVSCQPARHLCTLVSAALCLTTRNVSFGPSSTLSAQRVSGPSSPRDGPSWRGRRAKTFTGSETALTSGSLPMLPPLSTTVALARRPAACETECRPSSFPSLESTCVQKANPPSRCDSSNLCAASPSGATWSPTLARDRGRSLQGN